MTQSTLINRIEVGSDDWRQTVDLFNPRTTERVLASAESGRETEFTAVAIDDRITTTVTRRIQFHDLLRDAYVAAGELTNPSAELEIHAASELIERTNTVEVPFEAIIETSHVDRSHTSDAPVDPVVPAISSPGTSSYQEEVIVDRYAAIDAGFEPPAMSASDTVDVAQVRAVPGNVDDPEDPMDRFATETAVPGETFDAAFDLLEDRQPVKESSDREPIPQRSSTDADLSSTADTETSHSASSETLDIMFSSPDAQTNASAVWTTLHDESSLLWNGIIKDEVFAPSHNSVPAESDDVGRVADEIFSLGESLHPTGVLSSNSESILKALRREVVDLAAINGSEHSNQNSSATTEATWESIETTPAESATESRPFRYLFSMLRRKQQGLA